MDKQTQKCWCGSTDLIDYSPTYARCDRCETLVLKVWPFDDPTHVDDSGELYSKDYYLKHLPESYGFPSLYERARLDLTDRVPYWLRTLLKYRVPPASVLELGSAHGGFIAFLRAAGAAQPAGRRALAGRGARGPARRRRARRNELRAIGGRLP